MKNTKEWLKELVKDRDKLFVLDWCEEYYYNDGHHWLILYGPCDNGTQYTVFEFHMPYMNEEQFKQLHNLIRYDDIKKLSTYRYDWEAE